jgi:hypothetical protein
MEDQNYIIHTERWVKNVIVGLNFCPFAKREVDRGSVRYSILKGPMEKCLEYLILECDLLMADKETETTLLILPEGFDSFEYYLDLLDFSNALLQDQGYEGVFQLASFHPEYQFGGVPVDDPANYTNRSPYPMLHIIREASLEKAIKYHPDPEGIPDRNIELARKMGTEKFKKLLTNCF